MPNPFIVPLNAIRAIEIVARRGALGAAADELGVTPGAVSQHLRRAEERLGLELFERTPKGLVPTQSLREILPQLETGFLALADAMQTLKGGKDCVLTVTVGSVFASRWLIWRLPRFTATHSNIEIRLVVNGRLVDLRHSDIDCAIRFGRGEWAGTTARPLGGTTASPVCAPTLAKRLKSAADLPKVPVIEDKTTMLSWDKWFEAAGSEPPPLTGPSFDDPALAFDAAISGQGVLMAVDMMSADAVADGRLVRPFPLSASNGTGYWLAMAADKREQLKVKAFREWLEGELPNQSGGGTLPPRPVAVPMSDTR